ncbi:MAG: hypothetical protein ACYCZF_12425 [Anaerolineae bacterium]
MPGDDKMLDFTHELLTIIEHQLAEYEQLNGPLDDDLKRGLAVSYLLGVLRCDIEAIWDELAQAPHFAAMHPKLMFENCDGLTPVFQPDDRGRIRNLLTQYGWMGE